MEKAQAGIYGLSYTKSANPNLYGIGILVFTTLREEPFN
jgi:hypothetical protein